MGHRLIIRTRCLTLFEHKLLYLIPYWKQKGVICNLCRLMICNSHFYWESEELNHHLINTSQTCNIRGSYQILTLFTSKFESLTKGILYCWYLNSWIVLPTNSTLLNAPRIKMIPQYHQGFKRYRAATKYSHTMLNLKLWPWPWTDIGQT